MLPLIFIFFSITSNANKAKIETGLGVDYGGMGIKVLLPIQTTNIEVFMSGGFLFGSMGEEDDYGISAGCSYHLTPQSAIYAFYGLTDIDKTLVDDFAEEYEKKYGPSIGYKYFIKGRNKKGFSLGVTYSFHSEGSYPFVSFGYRY